MDCAASDSTAAAEDLLQLAGYPVNPPSRRAAAQGARARSTKPYNRPAGSGGARKRAADPPRSQNCWLPGGFWWQDQETRSQLPPGRQPGELAGWTPLAGERTQQQMQQQKEALTMTEKTVQGLESRDQAVAYLASLRKEGLEAGAQPINATVDDSVIDRCTPFKDLASWGGFRRHHVMEGDGSDTGSHAGEKARELQAMSSDAMLQQPRLSAAAAAQIAANAIVTADRIAADDACAPASMVPHTATFLRAQMQKNQEEIGRLQRRLDQLYGEQRQLAQYLAACGTSEPSAVAMSNQ